MKYPALLFDLDKTLFDTELNAQNALCQLTTDFDFAFDQAQVNYWHQLNNQMWEQLENKQLTIDELLNSRFTRYFAHYGIAVNNDHYRETFETLFAKEHAVLPHAQETLQTLSTDHRLFVVSNGSRFKQYQQLAGSHLQPYFEQIFLSEELGYSKPDPQFFATVEKHLPDIDPQQMVVIGDSLTADIRGAHRAGLDSIWMNGDHQTNQSPYHPTYEVNDLVELTTLLTSL